MLIDREGSNGWPNSVTDNCKSKLVLDVKTETGRERALSAITCADVLIEGFRPGVMERLGLGPDVASKCNPRLIYGRMTGWGQQGPLAKAAGHDINYIALTGALAAIGRSGDPAQPPLNLLGDFGGGSLFLALGIVCALFEREQSGKGQVIDAAIIDGVSSMMSFFTGLAATGAISMDRGENLLGGHAPFYRCFKCSDGREIAIGSLEPHFYSDLLQRIGAPAEFNDRQNDASLWPERAAVLEVLFATRSQAEWIATLEGTDVCFAPVLDLAEAANHPHMVARNVYRNVDGVQRPAPAPRFSRTPGSIQRSGDGEETLARWLNA